MARADRKAARQALLKAVFAGLGLVALILAVSWSKTWLYEVGAALLAASVAIGLHRRPRSTRHSAPTDTHRPVGPTQTGEHRSRRDTPPPDI
ncbi:hypothetical protein [Streptomyces sioyaensis]|uniref:hypothetical protein n=1 Tax=Streptomyces sioyaensis TaxID=67364 RepID=UPI0037B2227A